MKCQIFGIWHTKHHYSSLMRCFKCVKILQHATVPSQIWDNTDINAKIFYYLFIHQVFSLIYSLTFSLSFISSFLSSSFFLSASEFFSFADLIEAANLARAIVVLHSSLFTLILFLSHPQATWSRSCLKPPQVVETDLAWSYLNPILPLELWVCLIWDGLWGLRMWWVVVVVLWLWWQFGGCGGDCWVVVVVIFWVVVDFFFFNL